MVRRGRNGFSPEAASLCRHFSHPNGKGCRVGGNCWRAHAGQESSLLQPGPAGAGERHTFSHPM